MNKSHLIQAERGLVHQPSYYRTTRPASFSEALAKVVRLNKCHIYQGCSKHFASGLARAVAKHHSCSVMSCFITWLMSSSSIHGYTTLQITCKVQELARKMWLVNSVRVHNQHAVWFKVLHMRTLDICCKNWSSQNRTSQDTCYIYSHVYECSYVCLCMSDSWTAYHGDRL